MTAKGGESNGGNGAPGEGPERAPPPGEDSLGEDIGENSGDEQQQQQDAIEPGHYGRTMITQMTQEQYNTLYCDVYGRPPPDVARMERRMSDLEREVGRLPDEKKSSILRALRYNPLLFVSSAHTNLFLQAEEFDAKNGAMRMARYWEQRELMFGERAFSSEVFKNPTREDYLKYYQRCITVMSDPDADETMRAVAQHYVTNVRRAKIVAMDVVLEKTPMHEKTALLDAQRLSPDLAASDEHKLLFLHCEDFYEVAAAQRMIRYWESKRRLFGPEIFHRKIVASDFANIWRGDNDGDDGDGNDGDDSGGKGVNAEEELNSGLWRLMPDADEHGRAVVVLSYSRLSHEFKNEQALDAVTWYVIESALESPSCQKNGVVYMINYKCIDRELPNHQPSFRKRCLKYMFDTVPVQAKASHILFGTDCTWWQKIIVPGFAALGKMIKMKAVVHYGTDEELMRELREHGIGEDCVPVELGGNVSYDSWGSILAERRDAGI